MIVSDDAPDPVAANALAEQLMPVLAGHPAKLGMNALAYALANVVHQVATDEEHTAALATSLGDFLCALLDDIYSGAIPMNSRASAALH
jgi:hypothetical protein